MKIFFQWIVVICFGLLVTPVSAQDDGSLAIIERYESITGFDALTDADQQSQMGIVVNYAQGMSVETKTIVKQPDKIRTEAEMNGQTTILIINGDKGWVSAPGQPIMPMPEQLMVMTKGQPKDVASGYRWNPSDNTFKMGEEVEHDGKILQGVKIIPNKVMPMISNMVVYFDKQTSLPVYSTVDIAANGQTMAARVDYSDYKTFGKIATIPSVCKTTIVNGAEIMKQETKELEYNYLTTDDMFAEPK